MFFDEPTTGLDPIMGSVIDNLIIKSVRELGATALSITHDMASARRIADNIAMIHDGIIVWHGPVDTIRLGSRRRTARRPPQRLVQPRHGVIGRDRGEGRQRAGQPLALTGL